MKKSWSIANSEVNKVDVEEDCFMHRDELSPGATTSYVIAKEHLNMMNKRKSEIFTIDDVMLNDETQDFSKI